MKRKDLTGKKFGRLTVVQYNQERRMWQCECSCDGNHRFGNLVYARASDLKSGDKKSCGCMRGYNNLEPLNGKRFGRLIVNQYDKGQSKWFCKCDCGNFKYVKAEHLKKGAVKSCGCLLEESIVGKGITDKPHYQRIYSIWCHMKQRCYQPDRENYKYYGGKGIKVCQEWHDLVNFYNWSMENGYEDGLQIDRIDSSKDYCPSNCRYISKYENVSRMATSEAIKELNGKSQDEIVDMFIQKKIETPQTKGKQFFFRKPNYCTLKSFDGSKMFLFKSYKKIAFYLGVSYGSISYRVNKKNGRINDEWLVEKINKEYFEECRKHGVEVLN